MNRRAFIGGTSASMLAAVVSYTAFSQSENQQVATLATEIAELDARVGALETQVAHLGENDNGEATAAPTQGNVAGTVTLQGASTKVSDPFDLVSGRYRINVSVQSTAGFAAIAIEVFDPSGSSEMVMNQFGQSTGDWTGSVIYNAPTNGEYFVSVSNTSGPWSITFENF